MSDRRRIHFIKKRFQSRFILGFCLLILLESIGIGVILFYLVNKKLTETIYTSHLKVATTGEFLAPIVINVNLIVATIVIVVSILFALFVTSRVESNLQKFKDAALRVKDGDLSFKFVMKYNDLTDKLSGFFNLMLKGLGKKIGALVVDLREMEGKLNVLREAAKKERFSHEEFAALSKSLRDSCGRFEDDLKGFKLGEE